MAFYLVRAKPKPDLLNELEKRLKEKAFEGLRPFGMSLSKGLEGARIGADGIASWEEEDYCSPPLAQERESVLDQYFDELSVVPVKSGEGLRRIEKLPQLFPDLPTGRE